MFTVLSNCEIYNNKSRTLPILKEGYNYFFQKFSFKFFSFQSIVYSFKTILLKFEVDPSKIDEAMVILVNPPPYRILAPNAHKRDSGKQKR